MTLISVKALQVRRLIADDFTKAYEVCDVLLTPTTPSAAFLIGKNVEDPLEMYLNDVHRHRKSCRIARHFHPRWT